MARRVATLLFGASFVAASADGSVAVAAGQAAVAEQQQRGAAVSAGQTEAASATSAASGAIPQWRLDMAFNPATNSLTGGAAPPSWNRRQTIVGSTPGQDQGRCPMVKLPDHAGLHGRTAQSGIWTTSNNVQLASWRQRLLSFNGDQMEVKDIDGRLALKSNLETDQHLQYEYGWRAIRGPAAFPSIAAMATGYVAVVNPPITGAAADGRAGTAGVPAARTWTNAPLLDCDGRILYVARLETNAGQTAGLELYDRQGDIVAFAIVDPMVRRYQFVDTNGYLLATAESPGLWLNVSRSAVIQSNGAPTSYEVHFQTGGYVNASRLLDIDYRWAIAAALQMRAIQDVQSTINVDSAGPSLLATFLWVILAVALTVMACLFYWLYRIVYPFGTRGAYGGVKASAAPTQYIWPEAQNSYRYMQSGVPVGQKMV